ncbi:Hypothetical predicted protein [Paramuricea clavata]|uniref:Uncharacterized protein n=1 Tax=Paramuricea clavata TaxID=317549 RepID=A0A7D9EM79_PARCT|nr:Hypothetical predicted protein [Paramuricea clavata]
MNVKEKDDTLTSFIEKPTAVGSGKIVVARETEYFEQLLAKEVSVANMETLFEPSTVTINGSSYKIGTIVVTGYLANVEMPEFGLITKMIYLPNHKCYFKIKKQVPIHFNYHLHSFEVDRKSRTSTSYY